MKYFCPVCFQTFSKFSICRNHVIETNHLSIEKGFQQKCSIKLNPDWDNFKRDIVSHISDTRNESFGPQHASPAILPVAIKNTSSRALKIVDPNTKQIDTTSFVKNPVAVKSGTSKDPETEPEGFSLLNNLSSVISALAILKNNSVEFYAFDVEFVSFPTGPQDSELKLFQIGFHNSKYGYHAFIYDFEVLGVSNLKPTLVWLITQSKIPILVHDGRMEVFMLHKYFEITFETVIDTQIVYEYLHGVQFAGFNKFVGLVNLSHPNKAEIHRKMNNGANMFERKPYERALLQYCASDVTLLLEAFVLFQKSHQGEIEAWKSASLLAMNDIKTYRNIGLGLLKCSVFDPYWNIQTRGIKQVKGLADDPSGIEKVKVTLDISDLQQILPKSLSAAITELEKQGGLTKARDIIIDVGKRTRLFTRDQKVSYIFENEDQIFSKDELEEMVSKLKIGSDNRAILDLSFHRISCIRNLDGQVYGITLRLGRTISGVATTFNDILHSPYKNILILGPPGAGKSSIIRDCIRILADEPQHVIVVDTSNEMCGNGDKIHKSLGNARRMMVKTLNDQASVMIEAVQNHTPDIIIIDEIGRNSEVIAASTIKQRGVRILATAHGNSFRDLMKNPMLKGLLGGFEQVILSDQNSKRGANGELRKLETKRCGEPIFDVIVQLERTCTEFNEVKIIFDVGKAVDQSLRGEDVIFERRRLGEG